VPCLKYTNPLELACAAIKNFRAPQLRIPQLEPILYGPGAARRPREAIFQDEFYRALCQVSDGQLFTVPEYGSPGRIDFFVPAMRWGIEFTRFGDRLQEHISRFTGTGVYATMDLAAWIVLHCTNETPDFRVLSGNLYHVVFNRVWETVCVLNDRGDVVMPVRLLEG